MAEESPRSARLRFALTLVIAVIYVAWAGAFIERSAVQTNDGRYFCLFDDAMVSLRYA